MSGTPRHNEEFSDPSQNTKDWIDTKINAFRSEVRLLFVVAVAGNQVLSHITLSPALGYIGGGATIVGAIALKAIFIGRV